MLHLNARCGVMAQIRCFIVVVSLRSATTVELSMYVWLTPSRTRGDTTFVRGTHVGGHDATHYTNTPHQNLPTAQMFLIPSGQMTA
jgi:hypothetical protein